MANSSFEHFTFSSETALCLNISRLPQQLAKCKVALMYTSIAPWPDRPPRGGGTLPTHHSIQLLQTKQTSSGTNNNLPEATRPPVYHISHLFGSWLNGQRLNQAGGMRLTRRARQPGKFMGDVFICYQEMKVHKTLSHSAMRKVTHGHWRDPAATCSQICEAQ